jgi:hypothetical protein
MESPPLADHDQRGRPELSVLLGVRVLNWRIGSAAAMWPHPHSTRRLMVEAFGVPNLSPLFALARAINAEEVSDEIHWNCWHHSDRSIGYGYICCFCRPEESNQPCKLAARADVQSQAPARSRDRDNGCLGLHARLPDEKQLTF